MLATPGPLPTRCLPYIRTSPASLGVISLIELSIFEQEFFFVVQFLMLIKIIDLKDLK